MFYVIYNRDEKSWLWIKNKKEAILAAKLLSKSFDVSLRSSDGFGNYEEIPLPDGVQLSLFDPSFDDLFEKYIYHNGYFDFYAYRLKKEC